MFYFAVIVLQIKTKFTSYKINERENTCLWHEKKIGNYPNFSITDLQKIESLKRIVKHCIQRRDILVDFYVKQKNEREIIE